MVIIGNMSGASVEEVNMAVGPSELPMIPIEAASIKFIPSKPGMMGEKSLPNSKEPPNAANIPSCPPRPIKAVRGEAMSGPKSVIAPRHRKIIGGYIPLAIPWNRYHSKPPSSCAERPAIGMLAIIMPNDMGRSNSGSYFFTIAKYMRSRAITIMIPFGIVISMRPTPVKKLLKKGIYPSRNYIFLYP
jgi:hypothetical protein